MAMPASIVWDLVHAERRALREDLVDLEDHRWATPSLCTGWDVHDVLCHLLDSARTTQLSFLRDMVAARFDFDRQNALGVERARGRCPRQTLAAFDEAAGLTRTPPASLATRLVEAVVHGEDIRRPLRIPRTYPTEAVDVALAHQLRTPVGFGGGRERAAGLRLVDVAGGQSWGEGQDVLGEGVDLLMAVSGRPTAATAFTGPGAELFVARRTR